MNLQEQLNDVQARMTAEKEKGLDRNPQLIAELEREEADLLKQIMDEEKDREWLEQQKQIQQEHVERVEQSTAEIANILDGLVIEGLRMPQLTSDEKSYQLLSIAVQKLCAGQADKFSRAIVEMQEQHAEGRRAWDDRETQLQRQIEYLQDQIKLVGEDRDQMKRERDDFQKKLSNAAEELRLEQEETKRLSAKVEEMQVEAAIGVRGQINSINTDEQIRQLAEEIKNSRIKVTGIRWEDEIRKTHKLAERADTGEMIRFHYFEEGKYLEVDTEEAAAEAERFRQSVDENIKPISDPVPPSVESVGVKPPTHFPQAADEQSDGHRDDELASDVSRKEFEALRNEVTMLAVELKARSILPHDWEAA